MRNVSIGMGQFAALAMALLPTLALAETSPSEPQAPAAVSNPLHDKAPTHRDFAAANARQSLLAELTRKADLDRRAITTPRLADLTDANIKECFGILESAVHAASNPAPNGMYSAATYFCRWKTDFAHPVMVGDDGVGVPDIAVGNTKISASFGVMDRNRKVIVVIDAQSGTRADGRKVQPVTVFQLFDGHGTLTGSFSDSAPNPLTGTVPPVLGTEFKQVAAIAQRFRATITSSMVTATPLPPVAKPAVDPSRTPQVVGAARRGPFPR